MKKARAMTGLSGRGAGLWGMLLASALLAPAPPCGGQTAGAGQQFLELWGKAWDTHDVDAIMKLYADDCITVNRFGVVASGKDEIRRATAWLHNGPFHTAHFEAPKLLEQRRIAPGVIALQASWKNPSGRSDAPEDDLIMTVVLKDLGTEGWQAEEVDTHTVEPLAPSVAPSMAPEHTGGKPQATGQAGPPPGTA